uniref:Putative scp crisp: scp-like extracellular protein n=1 Tax=Desmodus rotundus TaxID=9430 RepID=K9IWX5_DESRO
MVLFPELLVLAAVLLPFFPANGRDPYFDALSNTPRKVRNEIVDKHNALRRTVSPPARNMLKMKWSKRAAANAQNWANMCIYRHSEPQSRTVGEKSCGENIFMSNRPVPWSYAIQRWFDEKINFTYGEGPKYANAMIGHYTQVAWYSSFLLGCGNAYCPNERLAYNYVCQYCSAGNIASRKYTPYLEGKPCASCPNDCDDGLCTNSCKYEDVYSNCKDLKDQVGCTHPVTKDKCKASCKCPW